MDVIFRFHTTDMIQTLQCQAVLPRRTGGARPSDATADEVVDHLAVEPCRTACVAHGRSAARLLDGVVPYGDVGAPSVGGSDMFFTIAEGFFQASMREQLGIHAARGERHVEDCCFDARIVACCYDASSAGMADAPYSPFAASPSSVVVDKSSDPGLLEATSGVVEVAFFE